MTPLLPVSDAIDRVVANLSPMPAETVPIDAAEGRTLAEPLAALRTQPPFTASSMDGYAVRAADIATTPTTLSLIGASVAGTGFTGKVGRGEAVRIFTGAPLPEGADAVVIQEDTEAGGKDSVTINVAAPAGASIRPAGLDFREGDALLAAGRRLGPRELALAAAMGYGALPVRRQPAVAVVSTGDELVPPGTMPGPDQIIAASAVGIAAHIRRCGGIPVDLGIARDTTDDLTAAVDRALARDADVLVTLGGASVGDHDLVGPVLKEKGMALDFWRIAMRPGKPLMFGRMKRAGGVTSVLGLPGNPVSSLVCAILFLSPLIDGLLGRPPADPSEAATLAVDVPENDGRRDYVRATLTARGDLPEVTPLPVQDSSMLSALAAADCLLIREVRAPAAKAGEACRIIRLS